MNTKSKIKLTALMHVLLVAVILGLFVYSVVQMGVE